jgi:hypothetical protein
MPRPNDGLDALGASKGSIIATASAEQRKAIRRARRAYIADASEMERWSRAGFTSARKAGGEDAWAIWDSQDASVTRVHHGTEDEPQPVDPAIWDDETED